MVFHAVVEVGGEVVQEFVRGICVRRMFFPVAFFRSLVYQI